MRNLLLVSFILFGSSILLAEEAKLTYSIESEKAYFKGKEQTFIIICISNETDKEITHKGYSFTAESFTAKDAAGGKLNDSDWVSVLRRKKRHEKAMTIAPKESIKVLYLLTDLFGIKGVNQIEITCNLANDLKVTVDNPK